MQVESEHGSRNGSDCDGINYIRHFSCKAGLSLERAPMLHLQGARGGPLPDDVLPRYNVGSSGCQLFINGPLDLDCCLTSLVIRAVGALQYRYIEASSQGTLARTTNARVALDTEGHDLGHAQAAQLLRQTRIRLEGIACMQCLALARRETDEENQRIPCSTGSSRVVFATKN
jgi:hypothetical protein